MVTEQGKENPLRREVAIHLRNMAERGPVSPQDRRHVAIHTTSLETLTYLLDFGRIPGSSYAYNQYLAGDISIFPTPQLVIPESVDSPELQQRLLTPDTTRFHAVIHARAVAQRHGLLALLNLPLSDERNNTEADQIFPFPGEDEQKDFFSAKTNRDVFEIEDMIAQAEERGGFILGFGPEIEKQEGIALVPGDGGEGDLAIRTFGKGLDYRMISGIEACGSMEEAFLRELFGEI